MVRKRSCNFFPLDVIIFTIQTMPIPLLLQSKKYLSTTNEADVPQAAHEGNVFENQNGNDIVAEVIESPPLQIHSSGRLIR